MKKSENFVNNINTVNEEQNEDDHEYEKKPAKIPKKKFPNNLLC